MFARNINKLRSIDEIQQRIAFSLSKRRADICIDILFINFDKIVMIILTLILLLFLMEKKLVLLSHICSIKYMGLVLWLWALQLNGNA